MKKVLIIGLVIVVLGVGGFIYGTSKSSKTTNNQSISNNITKSNG